MLTPSVDSQVVGTPCCVLADADVNMSAPACTVRAKIPRVLRSQVGRRHWPPQNLRHILHARHLTFVRAVLTCRPQGCHGIKLVRVRSSDVQDSHPRETLSSFRQVLEF